MINDGSTCISPKPHYDKELYQETSERIRTRYRPYSLEFEPAKEEVLNIVFKLNRKDRRSYMKMISLMDDLYSLYSLDCIVNYCQHAIRLPEQVRNTWAFVERASRLDVKGNTDTALDIIYDNIDRLLAEGGYEKVDLILDNVDIGNLSIDMLLGLLTSTLPAKAKLKSRCEFFSKAEQEIRERGELETGLLTGLES